MGFGQILQVVLSLGIVALALYLSTRLARRRFGAGSEAALRVVSRQAVSRTQNLVVVEANGQRHLVAFTEGGAHTVDTWEAPEPEAATVPAATTKLTSLPAHREPAPSRADSGGFAAKLAALTAGTQWSGLGGNAGPASGRRGEGTRP
ncbi:flagellar biosynthetic protein FliO [Cellulosimicrobium funkei]|nr:flagellar biosynthetic protein FliO [Cellulosimicrobium funkei]